jgi:hypothetical protein
MKKETRMAARRVASVCQYLGVQDALRKRREASQTPGAWAGTIISTDGEGVFVTVVQDKWDKAKRMLDACLAEMEENEGMMNHKNLKQI